jgi:hypothetical protein
MRTCACADESRRDRHEELHLQNVQASCAPFFRALQSHAADVASRASSHLSDTSSNRAGKPLRDIPAVVDLIQLHTIKKADKDDPLKVRVDSEEGAHTSRKLVKTALIQRDFDEVVEHVPTRELGGVEDA